MKTVRRTGHRKSLPVAGGGSDRAVRIFHALSDPTRLEILRCVAACERCVCDLTGALDAAQSRLSFHLKVLKDAGLISDRRSGRWVYYSIKPEALEEAAAFVGTLAPDRASGVQSVSSKPSAVCCE